MEDKWTTHISSKQSLWKIDYKELWHYRDLLLLLIRRDIVTTYKQTIFGYAWYLIQPLFTAVIFTLIFNVIANINPDDNINPFLFNLAGITIWNYFKDCFTATSETYRTNQYIFKSVYFPRVIAPISTVISKIVMLVMQLFIFSGFYFYFKLFTDNANGVSPSISLVFFVFLILIVAILGLGLGMIGASITSKYRDFSFFISFGIQLLMYASAVMYPLSLIKDKAANGELSKIAELFIIYNPISIIIETFRYMVFGIGEITPFIITYLVFFSVSVFFFGMIVFNKTGKKFIDTV